MVCFMLASAEWIFLRLLFHSDSPQKKRVLQYGGLSVCSRWKLRIPRLQNSKQICQEGAHDRQLSVRKLLENQKGIETISNHFLSATSAPLSPAKLHKVIFWESEGVGTLSSNHLVFIDFSYIDLVCVPSFMPRALWYSTILSCFAIFWIICWQKQLLGV